MFNVKVKKVENSKAEFNFGHYDPPNWGGGYKADRKCGCGGDDVRGCYDPVLVVLLNVQNQIRPYNPPPQKKRVGL